MGRNVRWINQNALEKNKQCKGRKKRSMVDVFALASLNSLVQQHFFLFYFILFCCFVYIFISVFYFIVIRASFAVYFLHKISHHYSSENSFKRSKHEWAKQKKNVCVCVSKIKWASVNNSWKIPIKVQFIGFIFTWLVGFFLYLSLSPHFVRL